MVLPVFTAPALPAGVAAVPAGTLTRLFDLIAEIKENNAYTEAIGLDLRIVGSPDTASHPAPKCANTAPASGTKAPPMATGRMW
jgi:hypothetical protein